MPQIQIKNVTWNVIDSLKVVEYLLKIPLQLLVVKTDVYSEQIAFKNYPIKRRSENFINYTTVEGPFSHLKSVKNCAKKWVDAKNRPLVKKNGSLKYRKNARGKIKDF